MKKRWIPEGLTQWTTKLDKLKYPLLILLLGLALLAWPKSTDKTSSEPAAEAVVSGDETFSLSAFQAEAEAILSQVDGAGKTRVLLTLKSGAQTVYQTDTTQSNTGGGDGKEDSVTTVIVDDGSGGESAVPIQEQYPVFQGAVVVCEGAGSAQTRLALVQALSSLTGLGTDQITVLKMKSG